MNKLREYVIYFVFIIVGIVGVILSEGHVFGEYLSLYVFKPGIKLLMVFLVAEYSFKRIDFQLEIKERNVAAGLIFLAIALVVAEAM